jgi:hypothetical protein
VVRHVTRYGGADIHLIENVHPEKFFLTISMYRPQHIMKHVFVRTGACVKYLRRNTLLPAIPSLGDQDRSRPLRQRRQLTRTVCCSIVYVKSQRELGRFSVGLQSSLYSLPSQEQCSVKCDIISMKNKNYF